MNSLAPAAAAKTAPPLQDTPDYCARALALWPRIEHERLARVRHDPDRIAALISRRTNLSHTAILELLGASSEEIEAPSRDN